MAENRLLARSLSEDDVYFGANPLDELRRTVNTQTFTPAQAAENRNRLLWEGLSVIPGPGNVISAQDAYAGAGDAYNALLAGDYRGAAISGGLAGLSGAGAVLGLPFGKFAKGAADAGKDTLNIFAGPLAKTADHAALSKAQEMAQAGASRDDVWRDTGWFQGADGKWRFEIDDSTAKIADENYLGGGITSFSKLDHPQLHQSYSDVPEIGGMFEPGKSPGGSYSYSQKLLHKDEVDPARIDVIAGNRDDALSTSLHEIQHHAQAKEGFSTGATPRMFLINEADENDGRIIAALLNKGRTPSEAAAELKRLTGRSASPKVMDIGMSKDVWKRPWSAEEAYRRTAGEVEARNVQSRMNMSAAERRAKAPWSTQDVPDDQQIVRFR